MVIIYISICKGIKYHLSALAELGQAPPPDCRFIASSTGSEPKLGLDITVGDDPNAH